MKKIIDGRRYDTEKAEKMASWDNGLCYRDGHYEEETLYRTGNGSWFAVFEGGGLSPYAASDTGGWMIYGRELQPLTQDEVISLCESNNWCEVLESYFAHSIVDA